MLHHTLRGRAPLATWLRTLASVTLDHPLAPPPPALAIGPVPAVAPPPARQDAM
jgi:hypothetical protein